MQIFFVTPEAAPFSRAGGLGDVSYHLPRALAALGHEVTVVVPKYQVSDKIPITHVPQWQMPIDLAVTQKKAEFYKSTIKDAHEVILIGCDEFFDRPGIYGNEFGDYDDNAERYIFFSKAALIAINRVADPNQDIVVHCHDWGAGLVPLLLKTWRETFPVLKKASSVFTYHNLSNQGLFYNYDFAMTGLDWGLFTFEGIEFHGMMNLTKAGLIGADVVTTVSQKYLEESLGPEIGQGLEGLLLSRRDNIHAVLNGVDYNLWDPATDQVISQNYSASDFSGKEKCRQSLAKFFGLKDAGRPTLALISKLLARKGIDLLARSMPGLLDMPVNIVMMGLGEDHFQNFLRETAAANQGRVAAKISYDPVLAHHIIAGADILMLPSRFEPCGLEQLYALKYGTIPVVRATGGLDDTVSDVLSAPDLGTGYKFANYSPEDFLSALAAAVKDYHDQDKWRKIMCRGMTENYSWEQAAAKYSEIYNLALKKKQG